MLFVPMAKSHFNHHQCADTRHRLPYDRYPAANNGGHRVNTYHVPGIGLSDLNPSSYLTTTNETTHFTVERFLGRLSNFSKGM